MRRLTPTEFKFWQRTLLYFLPVVVQSILLNSLQGQVTSLATFQQSSTEGPAAAPQEPRWELISSTPGWQPRDSAGEVVFRDRMWLMGGWFDSYSAPPRDVWSSTNGTTWKLVTQQAPWEHSDLPMTMVHHDRMWLMGGWYNGRLEGHSASNQVWYSEDGKKWHQTAAGQRWSPRLAAGAAVHQGKMWIAGGTENYYFGDEASLKNDVWSTVDGEQWTLETSSAPWAARAYHQLVTHNDRLWILGGGNYVPEHHARSDVWSSADGREWRLEADSAPWPPRLWFSAVSWRGHLWVCGGWSGDPSKNHGDVWYTKNGRDWKQLQASPTWKARHEHSMFVFEDKLWIMAGHAQPLSSEVWSLSLPADFLR